MGIYWKATWENGVSQEVATSTLHLRSETYSNIIETRICHQHLWVIPSSSDVSGFLAFTLKRRQLVSVRFPPVNWKPWLNGLLTRYLRVLPQSLVSHPDMAACGSARLPVWSTIARIKVGFPRIHGLSHIWDAGKKWSVLWYLVEAVCAHSCHCSAETWLISHF